MEKVGRIFLSFSAEAHMKESFLLRSVWLSRDLLRDFPFDATVVPCWGSISFFFGPCSG